MDDKLKNILEELEQENKKKEHDIIERFENKFPNMIKKNQCVYIQPVAQFMPNVLVELKKRWNIEFKTDDETGLEVFMCPKSKK